jgi:LysM repeat protein
MLGSIAGHYNVTVNQLRDWNELRSDLIRVGQELEVRPRDLSGAEERGGGGTNLSYIVEPGDCAGAIAEHNGVSIEDILAWNPGIDPDRIYAGQELTMRGGRATRSVLYQVESGDFVGSIASRHDCTIEDIAQWNPSLNVDRIRIGQELRIMLNGPEVPSTSVGRAYGGELEHGEQLPPHRAYVVRNPRRSWGTNETVSALMDGFDHMRSEFSDLPRVRVHDLSLEEGGPIDDHHSHQSGRDADIGYYHTGCRRDCEYQSFRASNLDLERQWALFDFWIERDMVQYIFMDYAYQEVMYEWLEEQGESRSRLSRVFQYPRGRDVASGVIRHEPNHANHMHVRFACASGDDDCR